MTVQEMADGHVRLGRPDGVEDLSEEDHRASRGGMQRVEERPPPGDHVKRIAAMGYDTRELRRVPQSLR